MAQEFETNTARDQDPAVALRESLNELLQNVDTDTRQQVLLEAFVGTMREGVSPETFAVVESMYNTLASSRAEAMRGAEQQSEETLIEPTPETHHESHELEKEIDAIVESVQGTGFSGKFVNGLHINAVNEQVDAINEKSGGYSDFKGYGQYGQGAGNLYSQPLDSIILGCYNQKHSPTLPLLTFMPMKIDNKKTVMLAYSLYNNTVDAINRDTRFSTIFAFLPSGEAPERLEELVRTNPAALPKFLEKIAGGLKELEDQGFPDHISLIGSAQGNELGRTLSGYSRDIRQSRNPAPLARQAYGIIKNLATEVPVSS